MNPLLSNKYIRFGLAAVGVIVVIFVVMFLLALMSGGTGTMSYQTKGGISAPMADMMGYDGDMMYESSVASERGGYVGSNYYPPEPVPDQYTSELEAYETTSYSVTGRTKQFDEACGNLTILKADDQIHFKSLNQSTNNCNATFFVEEAQASAVLNTLASYSGIEYVRNTSSVTRHRQNLQSQTDVLKQQLASVERSLLAAENQFDEIADFARQNKDAATLAEAISQKLSNINTLTQQKINLINRLDRIYQQSADLEERMGVVQFSVNINRSNPIYPNRDSLKWEEAWEDLKDTYTDTLIGLSAFFGIFLLWTLRIAIYLLILVVVVRVFWKFIKMLWKKW